MKSINPCLWFDGDGEDAAQFYCSIFKNSKIKHISRYTEVGQEFHQKPVGSVMVVSFEINGQEYTALNGGPQFKFNESVSLQVMCESQQEVDYYWEKLSAGGEAQAQACGWLKDKFGLSWQIIPAAFIELLSRGDSKRSQQAMGAMFGMKKLDMPTLQKAYDG